MDSSGTPDTSDQRLVRTIVKIRVALAELTKEYEERKKGLKEQRAALDAELLKRLHERGATSTKTPYGTAFITESMQCTIADEAILHEFLDQEEDPYGWLHKRIKIERLREYMKDNGDRLPPGLSIFKEFEINVRAS